MIRKVIRSLGSGALVLGATATALAQTMPLPPAAAPAPSSSNPVCVRLEAQLAAIDRGGAADSRAEQIRRYEEAYQRQQIEIDRTGAQARRMGCTGGGFYLFGGGQPPQCDQVNAQIQRMRANLDRIMSDLQRIQSGRGGAEDQRGAVLAGLAQNNCGPQYRSAARSPNLFDTLFGGNNGNNGDGQTDVPKAGTFRTVCVRTCDGFYFPISYATVPSKFRDDEQMCQRLCPASEVVLFSYRNPGEDIRNAVSIGGRNYSELPNALRYRQEYNAACSCKRSGQTWSEALKDVDDPTVERGDIVVNEEKAKSLSQPKVEPATKATKANTKTGKSDPKTPTPAPAATAVTDPVPAAVAPVETAAPAPTAPTDGKRTVRAVGPTFMPAR